MLNLLACLSALAGPPGVIVDRDQAPAFTLADGKGAVTLLLGPGNGSSRAALDYLSLATGASVPPHVHPDSDEILYVLSGKMDMVIGGTPMSADAGEAVLIPAGVEHRATCTENARLLQVYVAAGPEERFRAGTPTDVRVLVDPITDQARELESLDPLVKSLAGWAMDRHSEQPLGRIVPHQGSASAPASYRIYGIGSGSPALGMGLSNGDLLLAIGGVALTSDQALAEAVGAVAGATAVDVRVERRGTAFTLHLEASNPK